MRKVFVLTMKYDADDDGNGITNGLTEFFIFFIFIFPKNQPTTNLFENVEMSVRLVGDGG